ncbi:MAG: cell division protein FtsZ [Gammaproteobacteria bacterium]
MFELMDSVAQDAVIKVIGVGGGGGNAVQHMVASGIDGVDFLCANTDAQALTKISGTMSLQIGGNITKGLGAGANPEIGRQAALEDRERIQEAIHGSDMVFITAGMGGGTGTGAAPVVAQIARDMGILTVGVVTKPFVFEGANRMKVAMNGIHDLSQHVDSLITIPNDKLISVYGREFDLMNAFRGANDVLHNAVQGITELITHPGVINVDFADVRTVMCQNGMGMMGSGISGGEDRAREAAESAVASPLLEDVNIAGARGILVNVTGTNLTLGEFEDIGAIISGFASEEAVVVMGTAIDESLQDELRVTVVATGLGNALTNEQTKSQMKSVQKTRNGDVDFGSLDKPTVLRKKAAGDKYASSDAFDDDMMDIPAFLRRQAD